jgi:ATP-binding cassette subfamily B protein
MISRFYGKSFSLSYLRQKSHITREGVSLLGISDAAESIGFRTRGMKLAWEQLRDEATLPCIVHWNQRHFVVVYKITKAKRINLFSKTGKKVLIHVADPAKGLLKYSEEEFLNSWISVKEEGLRGGIALLLEPTPSFYLNEQDGKSNFSARFLLGYLRPYTKLLVQLGLSILAGSLLSLIFPYLTRSLVDFGIENRDLSFVLLILIAQMVLTLGQTVNGLIRNWINLHVTTRISISLISDFLMKLMRLPISFFDIKLTGDIMQRIGDHSRIQSFITGTLIGMVFSVFTLIMYSIIMAGYHPGILGVFFVGSTLYVIWVVLFLKRRKELDYKRFQQSSDNQSNIVQLVAGMQEIKLNGCEKQKRWEWERIQARLYKISIKSLALSQNQQIGATLINQFKDILISFFSARAVITGEMTLGMMMAIQYIIGQLNAPVHQFIGFIQAAQDARISVERLGEIHSREDEESEADGYADDIPEGASISVKNLTFRYEGPHSDKVLDNLSLEIPSGRITAIVGLSGSGKTTLIKLLLGFYSPEEGSIEVGGVSLQHLRPSGWRSKCGVVMQEGYIFSDTIEGNITVTDERSDRARIESAVVTANIDEHIRSLPLGFNTRIGVDGHGLSTGQKQRLLLARAIYKNPEFLFLDEATNSLDAENERIIIDNLTTFFKGRTVVVVAHRLSTVKNADNIIVLDKGIVAEQGSHKALVKKRGLYYKLVKDQLELGN